MAQNRDLFDDIIDISKDFSALKDPFGEVTDALMGAGDPNAGIWNPADYKERPRANAAACLACRSESSSCTACADVCPVDAISIEDGGIEISDACRKCGLCSAVCPTEAFVSPQIMPKKLYDRIAKAAVQYETCYVTCTRALRRIPRDNEICVACIGDVPAEVWFAVLCDFDNVSVYMPLDICEKCRTTTGEETLGEAIGLAEEWSGLNMDLIVDPSELSCVKRRDYERKEFADKVMRSTGLAVRKLGPAGMAVHSASEMIKHHQKRISELEKQLNAACGTTTNKRRRILIGRRQLVLDELRSLPSLAENMTIMLPECDASKCTMCGDCIEKCPVYANDLSETGAFLVEPSYCIGCGLCAEVCDQKAIKLVEHDASELVIPDPDAEKRAEEAAAAKAELEKAAQEGKKKLSSVLDKVEKLAD